MPRLSPSLLRYAASRSAYLPRLLRECRDLNSAINELRWLTEHAFNDRSGDTKTPPNVRLMQYVHRRSRGEPLQYILGTQPFGDLEILCRKGVLIPRLETELYTVTLAGLLKQLRQDGIIDDQRPFRIADLCTGTGCIALLLHSLLVQVNSKIEFFPALEILGADVSLHAVRLADQNLKHNADSGWLSPNCGNDISFQSLDVLELYQQLKRADNSHLDDVAPAESTKFLGSRWDVIISNPPYISPLDYAPGGTVSRSVREHEPKLALVPPPSQPTEQQGVCQADQFYRALLHTAGEVGAFMLLMEVGDAQQASRVRKLASEIASDTAVIETWRDDGSIDRHNKSGFLGESQEDKERPSERAVVVWTGSYAAWRLENNHRR